MFSILAQAKTYPVIVPVHERLANAPTSWLDILGVAIVCSTLLAGLGMFFWYDNLQNKRYR